MPVADTKGRGAQASVSEDFFTVSGVPPSFMVLHASRVGSPN